MINTVRQAAYVIDDTLSKGGDALDIARALKKKGLLASGYVINVADVQLGNDPMVRLDLIQQAYEKGRRDRGM